MSSFVNPGLLWGALLLAVPILIHLINLMRHRRRQWAAMEFLLASRRKNSTWIRLKELLLLLLRVVAIGAIVLMLAQPLLQKQWGRLFGDVRTNHIVLLDDSFSMSDRWGNTTAFDEAKRLVGRLASAAAVQSSPQSFSVLRFSRATSGDGGAQFDLLAERVDTKFAEKLDGTLRGFDASQQSVTAEAALAAVEKWLPELTGEDVVLYVVSDFRARDWEEPGTTADELARLSQLTSQLYLVQTVDAARPNVALTALAPLGGTRAAGVPVTFDVTVHNFSSAPADNIVVRLLADDEERPPLTIDHIGAGESETRRVEATFATAGTHRMTAKLPADAVRADNARFCVVELPIAVPVLIVDGDPTARNGRFLNTVFQPGGTAHTGLAPELETTAFLNKHPLAKYSTIYLTDVPRLDQPAIDALEEFVRDGGAAMFFVGAQTQPRFINDKLYRDGEGLFPAPLVRETQLLVDRLEKGADIEPADDDVFRAFSGERNSFLNGVTIERYFSVPKGWVPSADSGARVIARLRNGEPLAIERPFGKGRVMAMLTTAAPIWNNWGRNPSFVVAILEMQSYLTAPETSDDSRVVGTALNVALDPGRYQPRVRLVPPGDDGAGASIEVDAAPTPEGLSASLPAPESSGIYQIDLSTIDNEQEQRHLAFNVEASEGDLSIFDRDQLADKLPGIRYEYRTAGDFQVTARELAGSNLSDWILYMLVGILVSEQCMAYACSYHPRPAKGVK